MMNVRRFGKSRKEVNLIKLYDERLGEIQGTAEFHGDKLVADKIVKSTGLPYDVLAALSPKALSSVLKILGDKFTFKSVDVCILQIQCLF